MRTPTEEDLAPALELVERARAGSNVTDDLLAEAVRLSALRWSNESYAVKRVLRLALLASSERRGLEAVIVDELGMQMPVRRVCSVLLRDDDPLSEPFAANPWGIPSEASLDGALLHLWGDLEQRLPDLVAQMRARVIGLALCEHAEHGSPVLAYLHYHELPSHEVPAELADHAPAFDRREALAWEPFGDVSSFAGEAPMATLPPRPGISIPAPLRELYAIHAGLGDSMWSLSKPEQLLWWSEMHEHGEPTSVRAEDDEEDILSSQLLCFFGYGDDRSDLFDLRDPANPLVRGWGDGQLYPGPGKPFWEWLDDLSGLILGCESEAE